MKTESSRKRREQAPSEKMPPGWLRIAVGMVLPAAVWLIQVVLSEALAAQACYPHNRPLPQPTWRHLPYALDAIAVLSVLIAALCLASSLSLGRRMRSGSGEAPAGAVRFLSHIALLVSIGFGVAIVFTALTVLLMRDCGLAS